MAWLRDLAIAVRNARQCDVWLRPHELVTIAANSGNLSLGVSPEAIGYEGEDWNKESRKIVAKLTSVISGERVHIDQFVVEKRRVAGDASAR